MHCTNIICKQRLFSQSTLTNKPPSNIKDTLNTWYKTTTLILLRHMQNFSQAAPADWRCLLPSAHVFTFFLYRRYLCTYMYMSMWGFMVGVCVCVCVVVWGLVSWFDGWFSGERPLALCDCTAHRVVVTPDDNRTFIFIGSHPSQLTDRLTDGRTDTDGRTHEKGRGCR